MEKKTRKSFIWLAILLLGTIWILAQRNKQIPYNSINGLVFGTVYNITYQYDGNLKADKDMLSRGSVQTFLRCQA